MTYERKIINCVCCGKRGTHKGRRLRSTCWYRLDRKGRLDQYPLREPTSTYMMAGQSEHIMERVEMFAEMEAQGVPREVIAERLGVTRRTLERYATHIRNMERGGDRDG